MALFDDATDEYHECGFEKLYMYAKFFRDAYNHTNKIKLHGVTRKSGIGLPASIMQEELHNRKKQEKLRGTFISAELVGDSKCPSLIAVCVYDTKPVHFLSMGVDNIKWTGLVF